jgi:hypothetical protein
LGEFYAIVDASTKRAQTVETRLRQEEYIHLQTKQDLAEATNANGRLREMLRSYQLAKETLERELENEQKMRQESDECFTYAYSANNKSEDIILTLQAEISKLKGEEPGEYPNCQIADVLMELGHKTARLEELENQLGSDGQPTTTSLQMQLTHELELVRRERDNLKNQMAELEKQGHFTEVEKKVETHPSGSRVKRARRRTDKADSKTDKIEESCLE